MAFACVAEDGGELDPNAPDSSTDVAADAVDGGVTDADNADELSATAPGGGCIFSAYLVNGVCTCASDTPNVCAAGCTDRGTDDDNCGVCGHACPAATTCNGGRCGPVATNLVPAVTGCGSMSIAVQGGILYFTDRDHGLVQSVPVTGGPTTMISSGESSPGLIAVNGSSLYWIDAVANTAAGTTTGTIRKATLTGASAADLVSETNKTGGIRGIVLSADGTAVYYSAGSKIRMVSPAGGTAVDIAISAGGAAGNGVPTALGLEGDTIAFMDEFFGDVDAVTVRLGQLAVCVAEVPNPPYQPFNCTKVARSLGTLLNTKIVVVNGYVYFANGPLLVSANRAACLPVFHEITESARGGAITAWSMTPKGVYLGEDGVGQDGTVEQSSLAWSSTAARITRSPMNPVSMAVDDTRVYWSTSACSIESTGL
jgi:hypothetical protein